LPRRTPNSVSPNLLAVSKTIYAEAASFLYGQRISVADNYTLLSFLNQIGRQHTSMLREVSIKKWCSGRAHRSINFPAMTLLASATNLELLDIDCAFGYFSSYYGRKKQSIPNRVARKAFRDCYPWFEAIGKEKGKADAAVEMIQIHESNFGRNYSRGNDVEEPEMDENLEGFRQELRRLLKAWLQCISPREEELMFFAIFFSICGGFFIIFNVFTVYIWPGVWAYEIYFIHNLISFSEVLIAIHAHLGNSSIFIKGCSLHWKITGRVDRQLQPHRDRIHHCSLYLHSLRTPIRQ
jgi:hypothetical protein